MERESFTVEKGALRLDQLLKERYPDYSRSYFQDIILKGAVLLNGKTAKKRFPLKVGDRIDVSLLPISEIELIPEEIPLDILFEDEHLLAIDKPSGMVVHPAPGHPNGTFVNALLHHCNNIEEVGEEHRPGIVHRLDKDTSGVLIAAKTRRAHEALVNLFAERKMKKEYLAICIGNPGNGTVNQPIGRHSVRRKEMTISEKGKHAVTHYETLEYNDCLSLVRLFPETGRTHQIRVHLQFLGTPVFGDPLYGFEKMNRKQDASRMMLHAHRLSFIHPFTKKEISLQAESPLSESIAST